MLSFPGPDRSIDMEDLSKGKAVSRLYRNRRIGEFLKELELTEGRSTGIPKILRSLKENNSPPPEFKTDDDRTYYYIKFNVNPEVKSEDIKGPMSGPSQGPSQMIGQLRFLRQFEINPNPQKK